MAEKRRVYQVAKEKKLSSDALISMLKSLGHEVKSHMSVVTSAMLEAITKKIEDETKSSVEEVQRQKVKETQRKAEERAARQPETKDDSTQDSRARRRNEAPAATATDSGPGARGGPEDADRRRGKRRGKTDEEKLSELRATHSERPSDKAPARSQNSTPNPNPTPNLGGRWRGGGRRRGRKGTGDTQAVQDSVRKTLSQISEGRTRRRYDRQRDEGGDETGSSAETQVLHINEFATVAEFAEAMHVRTAEVMGACLQLGVVVTINQRLDMDTMVTVADEFGFELRALDQAEVEEEEEEEDTLVERDEGGEPASRPPVVTVMGHVDHGKTSLLDHLRNTNVAEGESGGITQHIGAYTVKTLDKSITFLDTPGHAAFTAMRARGTRVTDLVILVVAANDSVMPQTVEAIDHAKAASVPIVVAINKTDLPTADVDKIKRELAEHDLLVEEWGGQIACAEISAKTGAGMDKLLELVLLEAELQELQAVPDRRARGTIVEAKLDRGRGPMATVLIQDGTLRKGDPFVTGLYGGRVRALMDENMQRVDDVSPGLPVQVLGLSGVPQAGDTFAVVPSDRTVKDIIQRRQQIKREQEARRRSVTLGDLQHQIQEGRIKELNVVLKGDVDGSVEAIAQELGSITHEEVRITVIHSGVGPISESDVLLASASNAVVIAFHVPIEVNARDMAANSGVEIREYEIIYEVVEELRGALSGLLAPTLEERIVATLEVRQTFSSSRTGMIAGCFVQDGKIVRNNQVRLKREEEVLWKGAISSLRRFKDDVREVGEGFECGISLDGFDEVTEGDLIEAIEVVEIARSL
ncbi:MAG: translation initiation factor IF-2 [Candidatus Latescibacterota bacterium]|nr:translation initiation factor IF-2 [Candidatus Latescibacterota bacterium]